MPKVIRAAAAVLFLAGGASALPAAAADEDVRSAPAFSYREGEGARVDIVGLRPVSGRVGGADVKRTEGRTRIKLKMEPLPHPQTLGGLYTTYLLWAIAPEGRVERLAELRHSERFDVDVTTSFPSFALVVTAEPHAGVLHPGPRLVAENALRADDEDAARPRGVEYTPAAEYTLPAFGESGFTTPLPLLGARRAVEIARAAGASELAEAELREAEVKLAALEQIQAGKKKLSKDGESLARDVMRLAEEARSLAVERRQAARLASERRSAQRAIANAEAEAERQRRAAREEEARAQSARQEAEARAEAERLAQEQAAAAQQQAAAAEAQAQQAQVDADRARLEAEQAQRRNAELQDQLYRSLSAVLETRREARGLIVSLSDVLFDTAKASLKPGAREKLSRLAGILLAYPGSFNIEVEGHTDSVGSHEYNERLSRSRAESVRAYLEQAGIAAERFKRVTAFGETEPVATNANAAGRQMNRRVELVIADLNTP
jgi:outer membrane protein OmpA-like peptidoglycan-associated protein